MKRTLRDVASIGMQYREAFGEATIRKVEDANDETTALYEVAISTESEIERWFGLEVLSHEKGAVDFARLKRGAPVLVDHDTRQHVGVVEEARIDSDRVLRGKIRFSRSARAQEIEQDVKDKIRSGISVGYFIRKAKKVEERDGGVEVWKATRWQPAEVSVVSVPADLKAGFGRSGSGDDESRLPIEIEDGPEEASVAEERTMKVQKAQGAPGDGARGVVEVDDTPAATNGNGKPEGAGERDRMAEVVALASANGMAERAADWIKRGLSPDQISTEILKAQETRGAAQPAAEALEDVAGSDWSKYSYARAILIGAALREGGKFDGLEAEVHRHLESRMPEGYESRGGVLVPTRLQKRTLDSKTLSKGTELVRDQPGEFIELLRARAISLSLGARLLTGLSGPVTFTKQTGGLTVYWVGENPTAEVANSDVSLGLVLMSPKTLQGSSAYSRQLLAQASIDVEAMIRDELAIAHSLAVDRSAFHGLGAGGEPTGVYKMPDVNSHAVGGAPDYADVITSEGLVADKNADMGALGWATTPLMAAKLMQTLDFAASSAGRPIWTGTFREGTMGGYRASTSTQVSKTMSGSEATGGSEHGGIFGNWSDLVVGLFNAMELIADPYTLKKKALIEVTSFQMADQIIRHGESFTKWTGATV